MKTQTLVERLFVNGTAKSVIGLGITTTIGYGTLYYSFTIMSGEIQNEFGWTKTFIFGIFSLGILFGGFLAPLVGKLLDKHGARNIMSVGSFLCTLGLVFLSLIETQWHYIGAILFLEIVSTLVLYEAAFVAFAQLAGNNARLPITQITLIAGFASTIFWPLISFLLTIFSWRDVYLMLSFFHIAIAFPIHYIVLKKDLLINSQVEEKTIFSQSLQLEGKIRKHSIIVVGIVFTLIAIPITVMQTHFLGLMQGFGFEIASAIALGALIGPAQVGARFLEIFISKKISPLVSGIISTSIMSLGILCLIFSGYEPLLATLFVLFYGAGQGLSNIIRGSIPLYLFGQTNFGKTTGNINMYRTIMVAFVPFGFAYMIENFGVYVSSMLLFTITIIATILLLFLYKNIQKDTLWN